MWGWQYKKSNGHPDDAFNLPAPHASSLFLKMLLLFRLIVWPYLNVGEEEGEEEEVEEKVGKLLQTLGKSLKLKYSNTQSSWVISLGEGEGW